MWNYHIRLKASTFHSFKWIKKYRKTKILFAFPYYEAQIKSNGFSSRKENKGNLI